MSVYIRGVTVPDMGTHFGDQSMTQAEPCPASGEPKLLFLKLTQCGNTSVETNGVKVLCLGSSPTLFSTKTFEIMHKERNYKTINLIPCFHLIYPKPTKKYSKRN